MRPRAAAAATRIDGGPATPGYQLEGFRWSRTSIPVYYNWEGGTCAFGGSNFSGPPTSIPPSTLTDTLSAAITDLNQKLRGGLVLEFAGPATHAELQQVFEHRLLILQVQDRWIALNA